jgi:WD40 repeat protein
MQLQGVKVARFEPEGRYVAMRTDRNIDGVEVWDVVEGKLLQSFTSRWGLSMRTFMEMNMNGVEVLDVDEGGVVQFPSRRDPREKGTYGPLVSVAWAPDGRRLAAGSHEGVVVVWDRIDRSAATR